MKKNLACLLVFCMMLMLTLSACKSQKDVGSNASVASDSSDNISQESDVEALPDDESSDVIDADTSAAESKTSSSKTQSQKTTSKSTGTTNTNVKLIKDLKGYTFVIAVSRYGDQEVLQVGESDLADAQYSRDKYIEKAYNCKIKYQYYEPTTFFDSAKAVIMGGDKFADLMMVEGFVFGRLYVQNMLYDISKLPGVNLKSDAYLAQHTEAATFKDGVYGTNFGINPASRGGMLVHYNKKIIKERKLEDPQDLVKSGNWTWDKFKELIDKSKKDLDGNGSFTEKDCFGATSASYSGVVPAFFSSGIPAISKTADKKLEYNLKNANAMDALLKFSNIFSGKGSFYAADFQKQMDQYLAGKATFYIGGLNDPQISGGGVDAVVPVPLYKKGMKYVAGQSHDVQLICVPKTIKDASKTGTLMQALAEKSKSEYDIYLEEQMASFSDDTSAKMYKDYIFSSCYLDPMMFLQHLDMIYYDATNCVIGNPVMSGQLASDLIYANSEQAQALLDEMFNER